MKVLDHGSVALYDWMGDDLRIVNMARQSFGQESRSMGEAERGLINFLMENRHGTPFEGVVFTFNVKCPIFVAREWFRHRIGSFNEFSGRYTEMPEEFYDPAPDQIRTQVGKPGHYRFEEITDKHKLYDSIYAIKDANRGAFNTYKELLDHGVAKEVARIVLPLSIYTQFTWVVNLRSLFNFINLRSSQHAMWEIRQYSLAIEDLIKEHVPVAYDSFVKNGKIAP
jgi:thymidylate synthase (FAD)